MPVGTRGAIRGVHPDRVAEVGASMVLANTYHLWERPGHERIRDLGGLHTFMGWSGPILTDSGGYQVFSLRDRMKLTEQGVRFRSTLDGSERYLTPELAVEIQEAFGVDVAMAFDECLEHPATRERAIDSTNRTTRWLKRCLAARKHADRTALFGIVQGGTYPDLRAAHAAELAAMDLDGIAIGGLSVGEGQDAMLSMVEVAVPELPAGKVRYLMGVGHPTDIVEAVLRGVDLFDCVLPSRAGRHAWAYTWDGRRNLKNARYKDDPAPLDPATVGSPANRFSRAYLRHLFHCDDSLARAVLTLHNLRFYQQLVGLLREAIAAGDEVELQRLRVAAKRATEAA
jgi:queuine tRNA-ribosyltransferase